MVSDLDLKELEKKLKEDFKLIKVERPAYEVVEEKKELLTEEEKLFLKQLLGTCKNAKYIMIDCCRDELYFYKSSDGGWILDHQDFELSFNGLNSDEFYSLKELGLED